MRIIYTFGILLLMGPFCDSLFAGGSSLPDRPNIVFFLIDDLGWSDPGFMGSDFYETPHIDRLARNSLVFTDAYACAPNCAPSRACLMTGLYTPRHGIYTVGDPRRGNHRARRLEPVENTTVLADSFVTIAEALGKNGYSSASIGKWHLGPDPRRQGFDVNIAGREWGSPSGGGYHSPFRYPNLISGEPGRYLTDALTQAACEFIENSRSGPFFLYLTHYAVHTPIQAKDELVNRYQKKNTGRHHHNARYAAMLESVDDSVGTVLRKLDESGLRDSTIVIFYSDNGGYGGATSNYPLRGAKGMLYEGGIREPLIVQVPGVTRPGTRCGEPVTGVDFFPTILELTHTSLSADQSLDGESFASLLSDPSGTLEREAIFWHFPCYLQGKGDPHGGPFRTTPAGAVRKGDWKLIEWFETGRTELYNLADDLGESRDLSQTEPARLRELQTVLNQWRQEVRAPIPAQPNPRFDPAQQQK